MTKQIPLSQGKFALVDDDDYDAVSAYTWNFNPSGYAVTTIGNRKDKKTVRLHHLIIGDPPADLCVDHIDGNGLNNQRANLRWATSTQNAYNRGPHRDSTSRFKGVSWNSRRQHWIAQIKFNEKPAHLGSFMSEFDAARAYNAAAAQHFGEHARLNVIPDDADETVRYRQAIPFAHSRTSKYRGVSFSKETKRWEAVIQVKYKTIHLGFFDIPEEAACAYDAAAKLHHGDRAFLNFPD